MTEHLTSSVDSLPTATPAKRTRGDNRPVQRNGRWTIRWYDEAGARRRLSFEKKRDAEEQLRAELHRVDLARKGLAPAPARVPERHTFDELADHWVEHRQKRSKEDDVSILRRHLRPEFGRLVVEDVSFERIAAWRTRVTEEGRLAPKTIHNVLTLLVAMLNEAVDLKWLTEAPRVRKPKIPKMNSRDYKWLRTADEVRRFMSAARRQEDPTVAALYATAIYTGLREGELAGLRWEDVDLERRTLHVRRSFGGPTKSGDDRIVPLVDDAHALLSAWQRRSAHGLVFVSRKGTMLVESARIFQDVLHRVLRAAGLPKGYITFHSLRHTFASWWVIQGGNLFKLQNILGHGDPKVTMRYAHLAPHAYVEDRQRLSGFSG